MRKTKQSDQTSCLCYPNSCSMHVEIEGKGVIGKLSSWWDDHGKDQIDFDTKNVWSSAGGSVACLDSPETASMTSGLGRR